MSNFIVLPTEKKKTVAYIRKDTVSRVVVAETINANESRVDIYGVGGGCTSTRLKPSELEYLLSYIEADTADDLSGEAERAKGFHQGQHSEENKEE